MENNEIKKLSPNKEKDPAKPSMKWYAFLTDLGLYMYLVINALFAFSTVAGLTTPRRYPYWKPMALAICGPLTWCSAFCCLLWQPMHW